MKRIIEKINITLLCLGLLFPTLCAQVTVGVAEYPAEGALLQLKDIVAAAAGDKNAKKGLLMPRVSLVNESTLAPMFPHATDGEKMEHAGLIVYNLTDIDPLKKGIMVWNGYSWNSLKAKDKDADPDIKKILYSDNNPKPDKSVAIKSIEVSLGLYNAYSHESVPQFRMTDSFKPAGANQAKYLYNLTRYWTGERDNKYPNGEFSTDLILTSFTEDNYSTPQDLRSGYMTTREKDEIWLLDDTNDDIFHINFFEMGPPYYMIDKLYAILVERF
ncbi:MAG: hypothetical protein LBQ39_07210 [Tannerellaceae bacterium]|jgi:hypothetical protein|nr:hypothetical protein [Tannerellaceae bacterium]